MIKQDKVESPTAATAIKYFDQDDRRVSGTFIAESLKGYFINTPVNPKDYIDYTFGSSTEKKRKGGFFLKNPPFEQCRQATVPGKKTAD